MYACFIYNLIWKQLDHDQILNKRLILKSCAYYRMAHEKAALILIQTWNITALICDQTLTRENMVVIIICTFYGVLSNFHEVCWLFDQHWALAPRDDNKFLVIFDFNISKWRVVKNHVYGFWLRSFYMYFEVVTEKTKIFIKQK